MKEKESIFGRIAYFGTLAIILITAIPHGTTEPWHKGVFVTAIALLGVLRVVDGIVHGFRVAEPVLLLPMAGIVLLAVAQLVPVSAYPASFDPYQTQAFALTFGGVIVFAEILLNYTKNNSHLGLLASVVIIVAIGSALVGLVLHLINFGEIGPSTDSVQTERGFAQFANRNHFALLAEMGLGLLIGLLLKGGFRTTWKLVGSVGCVVLFYSIIASSTRGGLVSLTGMAVLAVFIHVMSRLGSAGPSRSRTSTPQRRSSLPAKIITAAGLCVITVGIIVVLVAFIGGDALVSRIEQIDREIGTVEQARVNRASIWDATIEMIKDHPVLGVGFGAYGSAITKYDRSNGHFLLEQAHNDYLEIAANGGIVGALLFLAFAILVSVRLAKNMTSSDRFRQACCFGALVGTFGVFIHSFVDFGLHILVNALVFAALIVIGTANTESSARSRIAARN